MIPIRDENPTELTPFVSMILIGLNVAAWILLQGAGSPPVLLASIEAFGSVPCEVTGGCPVRGLGQSALLTSLFMHGSWGHLIGNMVFLWVFGNNVEDSMGHLRFIVFYLVCGLTASAAHILFAPNSAIPMVGASGAISGIMGAYVLLYPRVRVHTWLPPFFFVDLPAWYFLGYWFVIQLMMGLSSLAPTMAEQGGVAVWAHVGGFVAGVVLIRLFEKRRLTEAKRKKVKLSRAEIADLEW
ncbi:MAG TPA: rhomboid family intramembrane serine protease [Longimicrobiaceae bacterium]